MEFNVDTLQDILYTSFLVSLKVALPFLISGFLFGIFISIIQSAMQLQDPTINFVPKILILLLLTIFVGPYVLSVYTDYLVLMMKEISTVR